MRREIIRERNLSDPNWFFQTLLERPYLNNVIISPHYYPPTVSKSKSQCACSPRPRALSLGCSPRSCRVCAGWVIYVKMHNRSLCEFMGVVLDMQY